MALRFVSSGSRARTFKYSPVWEPWREVVVVPGEPGSCPAGWLSCFQDVLSASHHCCSVASSNAYLLPKCLSVSLGKGDWVLSGILNEWFPVVVKM